MNEFRLSVSKGLLLSLLLLSASLSYDIGVTQKRVGCLYEASELVLRALFWLGGRECWCYILGEDGCEVCVA